MNFVIRILWAFLEVFARAWATSQGIGVKLAGNRKGAASTAIAVTIVSVVLGIYIFATMFPDALYELFNATWHASIPASVQTLATTVVAIIAVVVFILVLLRQAD